MSRKFCLLSPQVEKVISFLESRNQLIFHHDKEVSLLTQDNEYSTVSRVSIKPPYTIEIDEAGNLSMDVGGERNSGFNYASQLKNMFIEAVKQLNFL
jgi:hypothetical protein